MQIQEQTRRCWTPLKIIGAVVVGLLAVWGLAFFVFLWVAVHSNFTW